MLLRTRSGEFNVENSPVLLEFLGVKKETVGPQTIVADVELIASVPFRLTADREKAEGSPAVADGISWTFSTFDLDRFSERIDPAG
jgi:hypothetical protein